MGKQDLRAHNHVSLKKDFINASHSVDGISFFDWKLQCPCSQMDISRVQKMALCSLSTTGYEDFVKKSGRVYPICRGRKCVFLVRENIVIEITQVLEDRGYCLRKLGQL